MATSSRAKHEQHQRTPGDADQSPTLGALDRAGQPEQAGLGEQVVDEQAADDERHRRFRTEL